MGIYVPSYTCTGLHDIYPRNDGLCQNDTLADRSAGMAPLAYKKPLTG